MNHEGQGLVTAEGAEHAEEQPSREPLSALSASSAVKAVVDRTLTRTDRVCFNCWTPLASDGWAVGHRGQVECCKRPGVAPVSNR